MSPLSTCPRYPLSVLWDLMRLTFLPDALPDVFSRHIYQMLYQMFFPSVFTRHFYYTPYSAALPALYYYSITSYISPASSLRTLSLSESTLALSTLWPNLTSTTSPSLTSAPALHTRPFSDTRSFSQASFATVLRFMIRDTFKNLSILISYKTERRNRRSVSSDVSSRKLFVDSILKRFAGLENRRL